MLTTACRERVTDPKLVISETIDLLSLKWSANAFISELSEMKNQKINIKQRIYDPVVAQAAPIIPRSIILIKI